MTLRTLSVATGIAAIVPVAVAAIGLEASSVPTIATSLAAGGTYAGLRRWWA